MPASIESDVAVKGNVLSEEVKWCGDLGTCWSNPATLSKFWFALNASDASDWYALDYIMRILYVM